ncbi:MAG: DapH/DapD/GlmU-related protein [Candidatus Odinarchaeota archaeon]
MIISLSAQPLLLWLWYFWQFFPAINFIFYIFFPLIFFLGIIILILSAAIIAKVFLIFINLLHKPKEGTFLRDSTDKDYCYWSLRAIVRKWPTWLARQLSLPLLEILILKILGVKTSFSNSLYKGWIDCEFIEFGKNIKVGQGSFIISNIIIKDKLIIKKVRIEDNVIIGVNAIVMPGTKIESNTILDTISMTKINQRLESNSIYHGSPAKKMKNIELFGMIEQYQQAIFDKKRIEEYNREQLKAHTKELSVPFHFYVITGWIIIGFSFILPGFFFFLFLFGFLIPNLFSTTLYLRLLLDPIYIAISFITPLIIVSLYLIHLFFIALFTKWFYTIADKRGPSQGVFDRNLDESSNVLNYYHFRSFLFKYPIFAFVRSPFPWLLNWELRFIGSNKVGKGTVFEETFFHSHIDIGKNCYIGTFSHISNHLVDGVYGEENLTFFGVDLGDNCIFSLSNGGMPGLKMEDNSTVLPMSATIKYDKLLKNTIFGRFPARKLNKDEIMEFTGGIYYE